MLTYVDMLTYFNDEKRIFACKYYTFFQRKRKIWAQEERWTEQQPFGPALLA